MLSFPNVAAFLENSDIPHLLINGMNNIPFLNFFGYIKDPKTYTANISIVDRLHFIINDELTGIIYELNTTKLVICDSVSTSSFNCRKVLPYTSSKHCKETDDLKGIFYIDESNYIDIMNSIMCEVANKTKIYIPHM